MTKRRKPTKAAPINRQLAQSAYLAHLRCRRRGCCRRRSCRVGQRADWHPAPWPWWRSGCLCTPTPYRTPHPEASALSPAPLSPDPYRQNLKSEELVGPQKRISGSNILIIQKPDSSLKSTYSHLILLFQLVQANLRALRLLRKVRYPPARQVDPCSTPELGKTEGIHYNYITIINKSHYDDLIASEFKDTYQKPHIARWTWFFSWIKYLHRSIRLIQWSQVHWYR